MAANNKYIEVKPYCINNEWKVDLPDGAGFDMFKLISVIELSRAIDSNYFAGYKWVGGGGTIFYNDGNFGWRDVDGDLGDCWSIKAKRERPLAVRFVNPEWKEGNG